MSGLLTQRRIASDILGCGESRVRFNNDKLKEIKEAITREDIKVLITKGYIWSVKKKGVSRVRARALHEQRKKGRRRGPGKRKGKKTARTPKKRSWINRIRPQRSLLQLLKEKSYINRTQFRKLYRLAKGGFFRSKRHLKLFISKMGGRND